MGLAPIVLFVYNRPWHTEQTLKALMRNELADQSVLYIYADGPKENATEEELKKIEEVRQQIRKKKWCKEVHIIEAEKNKGLATSIIDGATEVVNKHGKIIVLEDDIVTSKGFLKYMNEALDLYEKNKKVFHISGYMYPHTEKLPNTFFFNVPLCWGWATWKRAWSNFNNDTDELIQRINKKKLWAKFNKFGSTFLADQLKANQTGTINSWFVKWHASVMLNNGFCLFPGMSTVNNIGFDSTGIHNGTTDAYLHQDLSEFVKIKNIALKESAKAEKIIKNFYCQLYLGKMPFTKRDRIKVGLLKIMPFKNALTKALSKIVVKTLPEVWILRDKDINWNLLKSFKEKTLMGKNTNIAHPYYLSAVQIGDYSYIAQNSVISKSVIGKFCSIGPNLLCGWGIHPTNGISTSPMFYSKIKQNGTTLSETNKITERKLITIGNDVFIGANVTILDGVTIGDGAVIGAGAIVSKNIPPYAIAVGSPIQIIRYRFEQNQIESLLKIKWWNFNEAELNDVEKFFFDIESFIKKYENSFNQ